jgi:hypothetical protein
MTQLERLIARLVQLVEDNQNTAITLTIVVSDGSPVCWTVDQRRAEGLQEIKSVVKSP